MGAFGASTERDNFLNDDGTITTNAISNEYKDALKYLNSIYKEGLIDPEMFTCTYEQAAGEVGPRRSGHLVGVVELTAATPTPALTSAIFSRTPVVEAILPPVGADGQSGNLYSSPFSQVVGVSYLCAPEAN